MFSSAPANRALTAGPIDDRRSWTALLPAFQGLQLAALIALACLVWLARDTEHWRWWCTALLTAACVAGLLAALGGALGTALGAQAWRHARWQPLAFYGAYAAAWLIAYWAHPSAAGAREFADQAMFLALVACIASLRRPAPLFGCVMALLALVGLQVLGPRSVLIGTGRATHYRALDQFSGYPEIGLLVSLGATACLAILFATRRVALGAATSLLAAGFAATTLLMMSRSAMLTIIVVAPWLAAVAAVRFRTRTAIWACGVMLIGALAIAATAGKDEWARVASALQVTGVELDVRGEGWRTSIAMVRDHPWTGVGPGRYVEEYARYSTLADSAHAYNILLHTVAELGIVGLIAYVAIWARALVITLRASAMTAAGLAAFAMHAMVLSFFLRSQSEHFLANLPTSFRMLLVLGFVLGLAEACSRRFDSARS